MFDEPPDASRGPGHRFSQGLAGPLPYLRRRNWSARASAPQCCRSTSVPSSGRWREVPGGPAGWSETSDSPAGSGCDAQRPRWRMSSWKSSCLGMAAGCRNSIEEAALQLRRSTRDPARARGVMGGRRRDRCLIANPRVPNAETQPGMYALAQSAVRITAQPRGRRKDMLRRNATRRTDVH